MRPVWRFYVGDDGRWHWQKMSSDHEVLRQSPVSFDDYERCVAAAQSAGYTFERTQMSSRRSLNARQFG